MTPVRRRIAAGTALLIAAGAIAWRASRAPGEPRAPGDTAGITGPLRAIAATPAPAIPGAAGASRPGEPVPPERRPGSLDGTEIDGAAAVDPAGQLVIDLPLRRLFDYFLSASGEEPLAVLRARIIAALRARLPEAAAAQAIDLLDRYLGYRGAARQLAAGAETAGLAQLHELRARWLSPRVAAAWFGDEEAALAAALARRAVLTDPAGSPAERERALAEIDARTPAAVIEARAAALAPVTELARETAMRAAGASAEELAAARTAALGSDAAARLAELDRAHAAWDARLAAFRAERSALLADPRLDPAERRQRIGDLLARSFTAPERIRVEALDRIAAQNGGSQ